MHLSSLGRREVFSTHAWHVRLSRAKELCILLTGGNKEKVRQKKTFPLLQATVTWQPPRNLKYRSAAAYIRDLCERHTVSSQKCSLSHRHTCTQCVKPSGIHYRGGREGDSCQASGSKRWWLLFWTLFLSMSKK